MASVPIEGAPAPINQSGLADAVIRALGLRSRAAIEALVEQLIDQLDAADGDDDLEDGDQDRCEAYDDWNDPPLGGSTGWLPGDGDDAEDDAPAEGRLAHRSRVRRPVVT